MIILNFIDAKVKDQESIDKAQQRKIKREDVNWVASVLGTIGWIGVILSVLIGGVIVSTYKLGNLGVIYVVLGVITNLFIIGFAEIIRLLHKIYLNTKSNNN